MIFEDKRPEVEKLLFDDSFRPFRTILKRNGAAAPFRGCRGHSIAPLALSAFPLQIYTVGDHLRIKKHQIVLANPSLAHMGATIAL